MTPFNSLEEPIEILTSILGYSKSPDFLQHVNRLEIFLDRLRITAESMQLVEKIELENLRLRVDYAKELRETQYKLISCQTQNKFLDERDEKQLQQISSLQSERDAFESALNGKIEDEKALQSENERLKKEKEDAESAYAGVLHDMVEAQNRIEKVKKLLESIPSGIDYEADETNISPENMTAHIAGLIWKELQPEL